MRSESLNVGVARSAKAGWLLGLLLWSTTAVAADKVTFLTSWFAQAEHGGFYQAKATGLYEKAGLDVTLKMGGPQVNGMQLLLAGETDVMMGYDFQVLKMLSISTPPWRRDCIVAKRLPSLGPTNKRRSERVVIKK